MPGTLSAGNDRLDDVVPSDAAVAMAGPSAKLNSVEDVIIDVGGRFKYVLCKVYETEKYNEANSSKYVIRGTAVAQYHSDIYDTLDVDVEMKGLASECLGGGKIAHNPAEKSIVVFGTSQGYGKADHSITVELLKKAFPEYNSITWTDEE